MIKLICSCLVLSMSLSGRAQTPSSAVDAANPDSRLEAVPNIIIPVHVLDFRNDGVVTGFEPSPFFNGFVPCTSDGSAYVAMIAPNSGEETLYWIKDNVAHQFVPAPIPGLDNVVYRTFFSTESEIAYVIRGVKRAALTGQGSLSSDRRSSLDRVPQLYVALFNRDGILQKLVELPDNLEISHAALFPSGSLIVSGYDRTSKRPRLLLLNSFGQLIKTISQPTPPDAPTNEFEGILSALATTLVSHGDNILAWRLNTTDPILEIQSNGSVREVKATLPAGLAIFNILTSDSNDPWTMQVHPQEKSLDKPRHNSESVYFEVSPTDGSALRKLTVQAPNIGHIACKSKGSYRAFAMDEHKHFVAFSAR